MAHDHSHTNNSYQNPACCSCGSCVMGKPNITPSNANINPSRRSSIHTAMDAKMAAKHLRCHPVPPKKKDVIQGVMCKGVNLSPDISGSFLLFFCCCCRLINHLQKLLEAAIHKQDQLINSFGFCWAPFLQERCFRAKSFVDWRPPEVTEVSWRWKFRNPVNSPVEGRVVGSFSTIIKKGV